MRLTLEEDEVIYLLNKLDKTNDKENTIIHKLNKQLESHKTTDKTKKQKAMSIATQTRERTARHKITNTINLLRLQNKPITVYTVAKESGISFNTAKKYRKDIEIQN